MDGKRPVDFETVLSDVYGTGLYQIILLLTCSMTGFIGGLEIQTIIFMHHKPTFHCQDISLTSDVSVKWVPKSIYDDLVRNPSNTTSFNQYPNTTTEQCWAVLSRPFSDQFIPFACSNWTYDQSTMLNTVVTQFNLICDKQFWIPLMEAIYLFFNSVGFILAFVTDKIGRRLPLLAFSAWGIIICLATPFVQSVPLLFVLRCCRGMSTALMYIGINLLSELVPVSHRAAYSNTYWVTWPVGYMVCAGIAYFVRNWISLRLWSCLFMSVYLCYPFIVFESPRWLYVQGRKKEAIDILRDIAKWNQVELPVNYFDQTEINLNSITVESALNNCSKSIELIKIEASGDGFGRFKEEHVREDKFFDILRHSNLRNTTVICSVVHIAIVVVYYGLIMDSLFTSDDIFMNVFLSGLIELPTSFLAWGASVYLGRRSSTAVLLFVTGLAVLVTHFIAPVLPVLRTIAALIGKLALGIAYCVADLYITELYPTTLRNVGFFTVVTMAGIVSAVAPYINYLGHFIAYLPCLIYATSSIASACMVHFALPETKNCPLAQTVKDSQGFVRGKEREWVERRNHLYVGLSCNGNNVSSTVGDGINKQPLTANKTLDHNMLTV